MKRKKARKVARKPARKAARKSNPTKKPAARKSPTRARAKARRRSGRKTHTHKTRKTVQRSVVAYSVHARKSNPARRRRRSAKRRAAPFKRAVARAKRVKNPTRYNNPTHKKRGFARRRKHNPSSSVHGMGTATAGVMDLAVVGLSVVGGIVLADIVDRFVATRAGAAGKVFYNGDAAMEINAPPDAMRLAAQGALSVLSLVGAFYLHKAGHKQLAEVAGGIGIGAAAHATLQVWNDKAVPAFATAAKAGEETWKTRLYPDLQKPALDAAAAAALAKRNSASGAPRVTGPVGTPRIAPQAPAARPAPNAAGCGADMGQTLVIQQLQKQIADLQARVANSAAAPPEDVIEADRPAAKVTPIAKRMAAYG